MSPSHRLWTPDHAEYVRIFAAAATSAQIGAPRPPVCTTARVARQLGVHPEALRSWAKQAEIDGGMRPGTATDDKKRIAELEKENRELRRANEILKVSIHGV
jgi:transposase